ncbi:hypothetical protein G3I01_03940 [Gramella sp. MT6]|uniref:hypothetical protein n=1 Tax=Gramella sp. MT6 TaxID=2705471 RepID=UPI001C5D7DEF|nr:hypothetical protein [Gramella sp. MT6]QYA24692.1 hypothetical protein G3I01_03940 [Gramella sp. MT6]
MIKIILPAIITLAGNLIFYLWIKGRIDKSIEKNKIAYSGIFKEKILIYRELLERTYAIKKTLSRFQYLGSKEESISIMESINDYIMFYNINQPFLSEKMLVALNEIRETFQEIFDSFYLEIAAPNNSKKSNDNLKEFFEAGNKLRTNEPFNKIEKEIVAEMKQDLQIENFR